MSDFKSMYYTLAKAQLKANHILEKALTDSKEIFENTKQPTIEDTHMPVENAPDKS